MIVIIIIILKVIITIINMFQRKKTITTPVSGNRMTISRHLIQSHLVYIY